MDGISEWIMAERQKDSGMAVDSFDIMLHLKSIISCLFAQMHLKQQESQQAENVTVTKLVVLTVGGIVNWVISSVFFHELPIVNINCLWPLPMLTVALETFQDWWCKLKIQLSIELFLFILSSIQTTHAALNGF